jgi:DNA-binding response OmpR family regulator
VQATSDVDGTVSKTVPGGRSSCNIGPTPLRSAIEARGAVVVVARGNAGVRLAGASRPGLILLFDDGDGWIAVCNRLRRSPGLRGVPMVVVSSAPSDALFEQHRGLATAADDYVQGPVAVEALLERADRLARLGAD